MSPESSSARTSVRLRWRILAALAAAAAVLLPGTAAHADPTAAQIDAQLAASETKLEQVVEAYNKANIDLTASQAEADKLATELAPLEGALADANQRAGQIARAAYEGGPLAEASALLTAADSRALINRLVTVTQFSAYQNDQISGFAKTRAEHEVRSTELRRVLADQAANRQALDDQRKQVNADISKLEALRRKYGRQPTAASASSAPPPYVAGKAGVAISFAYAQLGKPYSWGAAGPGSYDCSGLTMASWAKAGVSLPHNASMQWGAVGHISRAELQPGDLVFYSGLGHVAIYLGNGQVIHAPTYGDHVRVASVDVMRPYGYGRPRT